MLLASVSPTPIAIRSIPPVTWLNVSPQTTIAAAVATITLLRSNLSAIHRPISGPTGAATAMMNVYASDLVTPMPCEINSVGTQLEKP